MKRTEQKVIGFIDREKLIEPGDKVLIALSGGPDSVFAINFFSKYSRKYKISITAVHFNHNLRGKESDKDELFCEELCEKLNIPFYAVQLDVKTFAKLQKVSIEEAARILRYKNLEEIRLDFDCDKIVTAHNINDNTETVLLNFFTGTGYSGFTGIPVRRGRIIRPIMCLTKQEILDYLKSQKIPFRIDSSNKENDYKRNFLRNKIIPHLKSKINPSLDDAIYRSSKSLEKAVHLINDLVKELSGKFILEKKDTLRIKISLFESYDDWIIGEVIKKVLHKKFNYQFDYGSFLKIKSLVKNQKGKSVQLSSKFICIREKDSILVLNQKEEEDVEYEIKPGSKLKVGGKTLSIEQVDKKDIKFEPGGKVEYVDADKLNDIFIFRKWKTGDKFFPLGMKNKKNVSDFLTDMKIETSERKSNFVLENGNNIVWVVGLRIDNRYKINSKTKKVYKIWMK